MHRYSFFIKLLLGNVILVGAIVTTGATMAYRFFDSRYRQLSRSHQQRVTQINESWLEQMWPQLKDAEGLPDRARIDALLKQRVAGSMEQMRLTVIDPTGEVLGESNDRAARELRPHLTPSRPEVIAAVAGRAGWDERISETFGRPYRYYAVPLFEGGQVRAVVRSAMPVESLLEQRELVNRSVLLGGVGVGLAALALGLLVSWIWYKPLRRLTLAARSMASGSLQRIANVRGRDELGQLARALDEMRESIARQIDLVTTQRSNLQSVVATLREGIIATDPRDQVVLINRAAIQLLDLPEDGQFSGQHIQKIVRVSGMIDLYNEVRTAGAGDSRQVDVNVLGNMQTLQATVWPVEPGPAEGLGSVMVIHDVTDIARAASMKNEFVANASHELRTPLATVKAAVESLACLGPEDQKAYQKVVSILQRHVDRLHAMTDDLLNLHVVTTEDIRTRVEPIRLQELATWARTHYTDRAEERRIDLGIHAPAPEETFTSDRKLVEMILQNLLDNAMKFTPPDGRVDLHLRAEAHRIQAQVVDTGCGIRPEEQSRVFERFYQADQARSGDARIRGTGLGLAIVKHAAEKIGATIKLDSKLGLGTTVTVTFPRQRGRRGETPAAPQQEGGNPAGQLAGGQ